MNIDNEYQNYLKSDKWRRLARQRMEIDNFKCVECGSSGTVNNPLEVHHISYKHLYHEEDRVYQDLMTLCHSCHKGLHRAMERVTNEEGKKGWKDNPRIPHTYTFNINGIAEVKEIE